MKLLLCVAVFGFAMGTAEQQWQPVVPETIHYETPKEPIIRTLDLNSRLKILNHRPISHSYQPAYVNNDKLNIHNSIQPLEQDSCSLFKVSMNQEIPYQHVEYEKKIPDMKEFTLCMWTKFHDHAQDHPLFSYAVSDSPKEIYSWISNNNESSFFSMAVHGHTFFRLNYPLKLNKWYHSCQSWNGKTGEWQIWVNAERVGRGFNNRLVGHVIKGNGKAISGQNQMQMFNKDHLEQYPKTTGLIGEITMVQLYHVALTAGKAHKDHKHHHAHHFKHDGTPIDSSTESQTEPPPPEAIPIGNGNFLIGNQIQRRPNLNVAGVQQQIVPANPFQQQQMLNIQLNNGVHVPQPYVNGQLGNRFVSEQLANAARPVSQSQVLTNGGQALSYAQDTRGQQDFTIRTLGPSKKTSVLLTGSLLNPANVQFIDDSNIHNLYKRDSVKRDKRDNPEKQLDEVNNSKKEKRGLVALSDGSIVDEALLSPTIMDEDNEEDGAYQQSLLTGLAGFVGNLPVQTQQKEKDEREPAEAEVMAVMHVCSGCAREPFKKALVISWRGTGKKLYSGAHYYKGLPICKAF